MQECAPRSQRDGAKTRRRPQAAYIANTPPKSVLALHIEESSQAPQQRAFQHALKAKLEAGAASLI
jgi:hypothetical protein